jgi:3-hydroxybutyryl-CoA dehydrogenase
MAAEAYASENDIDTAMRLGCGYRRGPFELLADLSADQAERVREMARR